MKIVVDLDTCESHGQCELVAPEIFHLEIDGTLHYTAEPDEASYEDVREAAGACPTQAITLIEE